MPSGIGGFVKVGAAGHLDVRNWRFTKEAMIQDATTTAHVDGWKHKESTQKDANGSMEVLFNPTKILETEVDISLDIGDFLVVQLNLGQTGIHYDGTIVIKSMETINTATGELIGQTVQWESDGPITLTVPP